MRPTAIVQLVLANVPVNADAVLQASLVDKDPAVGSALVPNVDAALVVLKISSE
jgi:hypothetical protein